MSRHQVPTLVCVSESVAAPPGDGAVAWATAERTAIWVGARAKLPAPYRSDLLEADFEELTAKAEELVAESTGLRSASGPARARVTDRWAGSGQMSHRSSV